jgi:hypothetical protein
MGVNRAVFMKLRFRQACVDCALLLLSHASYSASLVSLLLQQDKNPEPFAEPPIDARSTAAFLEVIQFLYDFLPSINKMFNSGLKTTSVRHWS